MDDSFNIVLASIEDEAILKQSKRLTILTLYL